MNFCFVILHYRTADDTIECIESIEKLNGVFNIVIVDNASNNGSIEEVEKLVGNRQNIYIIKNNKNLGFADGNNIGYHFAKNDLQANFIAICNNDTIINSDDFIQKCKELYEEKKYCLLGPDIESLIDHGHQNPMIVSEPNVRKIKKEILRYQILYALSKIGIFDFLKKGKSKVLKTEKRDVLLELAENVQLHGSFIVFSPKFIENEDIAFRTGTFLYMEESILFQYCKKMGYRTIFSPAIKVLHKEDSSTSSLFAATKQRREFVFKNMIQSLKVYCDIFRDT